MSTPQRSSFYSDPESRQVLYSQLAAAVQKLHRSGIPVVRISPGHARHALLEWVRPVGDDSVNMKYLRRYASSSWENDTISRSRLGAVARRLHKEGIYMIRVKAQGNRLLLEWSRLPSAADTVAANSKIQFFLKHRD